MDVYVISTAGAKHQQKMHFQTYYANKKIMLKNCQAAFSTSSQLCGGYVGNSGKWWILAGGNGGKKMMETT